jgi:hypothetical protein
MPEHFEGEAMTESQEEVFHLDKMHSKISTRALKMLPDMEKEQDKIITLMEIFQQMIHIITVKQVIEA